MRWVFNIKPIIILISLLLSLTHAAHSQAQEHEVDQLVSLFDSSQNPSTANAFMQELHRQEFTDTLIRFTAKTPTDTLRQQVWYWAAEYFYDLQQYDAAEQYALKALPYCQQGNNRMVEGDCLSILALIYVRQGKFEQAATYAKRCNQLDMKVGNPDNISSSLNTLAGIYMSLRQPKEAEKYILKAIEYCQKANNPTRMAVLQGMASEVYHHLQQDETALDYATQAYETEKQLGRLDKAAIRQAQRAAALITLHRNKEAKTALSEAIPGLRQAGNLHSLGIACNQMGLLFHQENNDTAAVRYYNEALEIFIKQHDLYNESHSRRGLYEALRNSNPSLAMLHNDRYNELRDSLYDQETGELLSKYAAEYDNDTLRKENKDRRATLRFYIIISIVILNCIIALWFHYRRRQQRRIRELMEQLTKYEDSRYEVRGTRCENSNECQNTESGECQNTEPEGNLVPRTSHLAPRNDTPRQEPAQDTPDDPLTVEEHEFLMRVIEVVNLRLVTREFSIDAVATEMGMSRSTFYRRLQDASGFTPKAYIMAIQMRRAENLLKRHPDMLITEVSEQCGFEDVSSFNRAFKRALGVSPSQYREKV